MMRTLGGCLSARLSSELEPQSRVDVWTQFVVTIRQEKRSASHGGGGGSERLYSMQIRSRWGKNKEKTKKSLCQGDRTHQHASQHAVRASMLSTSARQQHRGSSDTPLPAPSAVPPLWRCSFRLVKACFEVFHPRRFKTCLLP